MDQLEDSDGLRVGDREREQAVRILHDAVGGGYLDLGEFEERSGTVYAARTRGELRAALADLPAGAQLFPPPTPAGAPVVAGGPGTVSETLAVDWTTLKRRGDWSMPGRLVITGSMGTADLDLGAAAVPATGSVIEVLASWSTVKLRLGQATVVRTDTFRGGSMTTVSDKAGPPSVPGGPIIELHGHANWTSISLRRP